METVTLRLLPYTEADGPTNMAADEVLLQAATEGQASLRFYGWTQATVSLGYFQPSAARFTIPGLATLPWVRRPSGGATLVHHHELTYCLALPPGRPFQNDRPWMRRMHGCIAKALHQLGLSAAPVETSNRSSKVLCFQQHTPADLLMGGHKVLGSAQRKYRQALMQHGSILLRQSEYAPQLPGIEEITGQPVLKENLQTAILDAMIQETGWFLRKEPWRGDQAYLIADLSQEKYGSRAWNEKR